MRFCKLVPLDTFNITQSLSGKPTYPPLSPSIHCIEPENNSGLLTLLEVVTSSPLPFYLERASPLKASPLKRGGTQ